MRRAAALAMLCAALTIGAAVAADAPPAAREAVGKPVQAAQALLKHKRARDALAKLREADAVADKTPYETYVIAETRAAAQIDEADDAGAMRSLETVLATGVLPPAQALQRVATLTQLADRLKADRAVIDYAERYYRDGGTDRTPRLLMIEAYSRQDDFVAVGRTARAQLAADAKAGVTVPAEDLLLTVANSAYKANDQAGYRDTMMRLVTAHPKREYWADLLAAVARAPGFSHRLTLDLYRLRVAVDALGAPEQYMEAAELALADGFPGDARAFLDHGYAARVLGTGPQAARHKRLAELAARQAAEQAQALAQRAKPADGGTDGAALEKLGEAYLSQGDAADAIAALQAGLAKGGLRHPDDATLHLGIACLRAGQSARAQAILSSITATDGTADLARLWMIRGGLDRTNSTGKDSRS
jgi:hypothetical protein